MNDLAGPNGIEPSDDALDDDAVAARDALIAECKRAIEAIVLVAHDPVPADLLAQLLEEPTTVVEQWCEELAASYRDAAHGFELVNVAGGWRLQTPADLTAYVERFLLHDQRSRLSGAALETLAIVAYKQPISRGQIASIRGVDPDGVLRTLQARGYIEEVARDPGPGQAMLFGTTGAFLEKLGLASLDDLPAIAEFIPSAEVVEALEVGLRVTPVIDISTAAPSSPPSVAAPSAAAPSAAAPSADDDDSSTDGTPT